MRLMQGVFSNANGIHLFFSHEPPLQASSSLIPRMGVWSINMLNVRMSERCVKICNYLGPVHTATLEEFEKTALFLRLGPPPTLIRHENVAF